MQIITGDEKWVVYNNLERKSLWSKQDETTQSTSLKTDDTVCLVEIQGNRFFYLI